jgi:hypothetical protein
MWVVWFSFILVKNNFYFYIIIIMSIILTSVDGQLFSNGFDVQGVTGPVGPIGPLDWKAQLVPRALEESAEPRAFRASRESRVQLDWKAQLVPRALEESAEPRAFRGQLVPRGPLDCKAWREVFAL